MAGVPVRPRRASHVSRAAATNVRRIVVAVALALATLPINALVASASPAWDADLGIDLSAAPADPVGGEVVLFHAVVTNHGPNDAENVVASDTLPSGFEFDADGSSDSCSQGEGDIECSLGDLPDQASVGVDIAAETPCVGEQVQDEADVGADNPDGNPSNNTDTADVTVQTPCNGNSGEVENGGKVTTDPDHKGTQPELGVYETTAVVVPEGVSGDVSIDLTQGGDLAGSTTGSGDCPEFPTLEATTDQPSGGPDNRLALVFTFARCSFPPDMRIRDATMYKDAGHGFVKVPRCRGDQWPDPCVRRKRIMPNGDYRFRVLWSGTGDPSWRPG
jgi:uncharacterized repeat protein (TIGR01451 family)